MLRIGTGMEEYENYGVDFISAVKMIKGQCLHVKISGGISKLSLGFRRVTKIRESINYVFLRRAILESVMDVGIVNSNEMLELDELEDNINMICENLVFNKTEEAIDEVLARTNYERTFIETKKKNLPPPRKPRCKHVNSPRKEFAYDAI